MEWLNGTKDILRFLDLYTRPSVNFGFIQIPSRFIKYFVFFSMILTTIPIGVFCYANRNNFRVASAGILYLMANTSIKIIYLTLILRRRIMITAIDDLVRIINESKFGM